jgi:hypothetical protein
MKKNRVIQFDDDGKISQDTTDQQFVDYYNVLDSGHVSLRIVEHQNFESYDLVFPLYSTKKSILAAIGLAEKEHGANDGVAFITYQAQSRMGWPIRMMIVNDQKIPIDDVFRTVVARDASAINSEIVQADKAKFRRQLRELDQLLAGMSPNISSDNGRPNAARIELSQHQYEVLRAALRSVYDFADVESWDNQVIKIIRSLHRILVESRKLLAEAASIAVKPLVTLLDSVSAALKKMLDDIDHDKSD